MKPQLYISRINWRLLLVHFIVCWFFIHAFITLSYLNDTRLISIVRSEANITTMKALSAKGVTFTDLTNYTLWISISGTIGLLVAFIISLIISLKKGWFWLNPVIVLIVIYVLDWLTSLGRTFLKPLFWVTEQATHNLIWEFAINGIILLAIAVVIFSFSKINKFIENGNLRTA